MPWAPLPTLCSSTQKTTAHITWKGGQGECVLMHLLTDMLGCCWSAAPRLIPSVHPWSRVTAGPIRTEAVLERSTRQHSSGPHATCRCLTALIPTSSRLSTVGPSLTHSLMPTFTHSLTGVNTHSLTHLLTCSLAHHTHSLAHCSLMSKHTHSLNHSLTHKVTLNTHFSQTESSRTNRTLCPPSSSTSHISCLNSALQYHGVDPTAPSTLQLATT